MASDVPEKVGRLAKKLKQYKNDPEAFLSALVETLEADVRSKFQTKKGVADASKDVPVPVDVPFDETTVYYLWKDLRSFEVVDVKLTRHTVKKDNYLSYGLSTAERTEAEVAAAAKETEAAAAAEAEAVTTEEKFANDC